MRVCRFAARIDKEGHFQQTAVGEGLAPPAFPRAMPGEPRAGANPPPDGSAILKYHKGGRWHTVPFFRLWKNFRGSEPRRVPSSADDGIN